MAKLHAIKQTQQLFTEMMVTGTRKKPLQQVYEQAASYPFINPKAFPSQPGNKVWLLLIFR